MHLIAKDWKKANLSERHQALCHFAEKVSEAPKQMKFEDLSSLKQTGYSDRAIHDAVQIIGYFNYINRIADSLEVEPETFTHEWELSAPGKFVHENNCEKITLWRHMTGKKLSL